MKKALISLVLCGLLCSCGTPLMVTGGTAVGGVTVLGQIAAIGNDIKTGVEDAALIVPGVINTVEVGATNLSHAVSVITAPKSTVTLTKTP